MGILRIRREGAMTDVATGTTPELGDVGTENGTKPCFYDSEALEYLTPLDLSQGLPEAERQEFLSQYGEGGSVGPILYSPTLTVIRYRAKPGEHIPPHRHGVNQITFMLHGELRYGNKVTKPGMGYFSPDKKYSWTAGPEGAEFLEIFDGVPSLPIYD